MTKKDIPVTWSDLLERNARSLDMSLESLRYLPEDAEEDAELLASESGSDAGDGTPYASTLLGISSIISQAAVSRGSSRLSEFVNPLIPVFEKAVEELTGRVTNSNRAQVTSIITMRNALICCEPKGNESRVIDVADDSQVATWLEGLARFAKRLTDWELRNSAIAAIEIGATDMIPTFLAGGNLPPSVSSGETFQFNTTGLLRYLAVARTTGVGLEVVMPALNDFIESFPYKLAADSLDWDELLYVGRIAFSIIANEPASSVSDTMHAVISSMAIGDLPL